MSDSSPLLIQHVCGRTGRCFCSGGEGWAGFIIANRAESCGQTGGHAGTRFRGESSSFPAAGAGASAQAQVIGVMSSVSCAPQSLSRLQASQVQRQPEVLPLAAVARLELKELQPLWSLAASASNVEACLR